MSFDDANTFLLQQGSKSYSFENLGDRIAGTIITMEKRNATDPVTGAVQTFQSGQPKELIVMTLQTDMHEDDGDDGVRSIWMKGGNFSATEGRGTSGMRALLDALTAAGRKGYEKGGKLTVVHTGLAAAKQRGFNPAKLFMAKYEPPTAQVSVDDLFGSAGAGVSGYNADEEPF